MAIRQRLIWEVDWNLLRAFSVIADEASVSRAADRLSLTQPAVSNALGRLERQLGVKLADRSPRGFTLTAEGRAVAETCRQMMQSVVMLPPKLAELGREIAGSIDIAFASHVASPFLDQVLSEFLTRHAKVTLNTQVAPSADIIRSVRRGDIDLGICLAADGLAGLATQTLYRETFGFFCAEGSPYFGRNDIGPHDLNDADYATFPTDRPGGALHAVAELRSALGWTGRRIGEFSSVEDVRRMMKLARAIAPLPVHAVASDVAGGQLWQVPPLDGLPVVNVLVVARQSGPASQAGRALLSALGRAMADSPIEERTYPRPS